MMTSILGSNKTYLIIAMFLLATLFAPFAVFGQTPGANKAIYAQPLMQVIVPGEWLLVTLRFEGDFGGDFGKFDIKLDEEVTSSGIKMLGWERVDGEERIVIRLLTDGRLKPGLVIAGFIITDETQTGSKLYVTVTAIDPLPNEFYSAARKVSLGSVSLYTDQSKSGEVQVLSTFQLRKSFKRVAEIYVTTLQEAGWTIAQNDVHETGGHILAHKGEAQAKIRLYTDYGTHWVTVGVTQ